MSEMHAELAAVNPLRELDAMGWEYEPVSEDEVKCRCPAHKDETPSCSLNTTKKVWRCHSASCGKTGDFISFMALATRGSRAAICEYIKQEYGAESVKTVDSDLVEKYHQTIWNNGPLRKELYDRGIDDESIRHWRLGVDDRSRITIPITNASGAIVNVRRYRPGAPSKDKMRNTRGLGKVRLFPIEQLEYDQVVVCGGECKAIAVAQRLNKHGIGAISSTGGEDNWEPEFSPKFKNKKVWVCYDIDSAGEKGADKVAARLSTFAEWVGAVRLPLDPDTYPHGDVNDYFASGHTAEDFRAILHETPRWALKQEEEEETSNESTHLHLADVTAADYARQRVETKGVITAMDTTPYLVPKDVAVECDRNQPDCAACPVFAQEPDDDYVTLTINRTSPAILELVNAGKNTKKEAIRGGLRIPTSCKSCVFHTRTHYNVEDTRISPRLEISNRTSDSTLLPAMVVGHGLEMNVSYELIGRPYPHPRTQQAIFLVGDIQPCEDALDTYEPSDADIEPLTLFQPGEWTEKGIDDKLHELYEDLSSNVTRIFERRDLHFFIDLAYHSPMLIRFDDRTEKGWTEVLVVGDSAQGKSEATRRLIEHYGLGEKVEVKNASAAGLLGGLAQLGNRWMIQWGVIPRHDRRLVVLEELKGASTEVISRLTDMRSSGVAEIDKIEKRKTHARTRLLALSNPRSDQPLSSYSYGVEAVRELIGGPEDLRRFDTVLVMSSAQVNSDRLNDLAKNRPRIEHRYDAERCRKLILWAWSRRDDQVIYDQDAVDSVFEWTNELCGRYADVVPIVDRGSMRYKLARLSAALAARTASFGESPQILRIRKCHVDYIARTIDRVYSDPSFGYAEFSQAYLSTRVLKKPKEVRNRVLATPFPDDFVEQMMHVDAIEIRDICDWTGWERGEATELLSFLVRKHALTRDGRCYRKNPSFQELLRELLSSDDMKRAVRPDHIGERTSDEF